jgi:dipeptidyl aminopeptidase/acylaminoacyl peptidase
VSAAGHVAVLASSDAAAPEIFALENGKLRKLTSQNDALLSEIQLGAIEDISFKSKDGTDVHGLMIKPPAYEKGKEYPTLRSASTSTSCSTRTNSVRRGRIPIYG